MESVVTAQTKLQLVLFVWLYASVCEEVLTRGLLQSLVAGTGRESAGTKRALTPVPVSAGFFGAMHLVLNGSMGPAAVVPILLATRPGFAAGRYRQSTGSLIPAVMIHLLFNIGGMLPGWLIG